jgi:hypothetical protein
MAAGELKRTSATGPIGQCTHVAMLKDLPTIVTFPTTNDFTRNFAGRSLAALIYIMQRS